MNHLTPALQTEKWLAATWEEYLQIVADPQLETADCYYFDGYLRIEMAPQGFDHSFDNLLIGSVINLWSGIKSIPITGVTHCSFRKVGEREVQPDLAFYIGENAETVPHQTSIVDLAIYPPPDLAIEVAKTSLSDDLGRKRMLYERLGVKEYWVINVQECSTVAFAVADGGSRQISQSQLLPSLSFSLLAAAMGRSRSEGRSQLYPWLIAQLQTLDN